MKKVAVAILLVALMNVACTATAQDASAVTTKLADGSVIQASVYYQGRTGSTAQPGWPPETAIFKITVKPINVKPVKDYFVVLQSKNGYAYEAAGFTWSSTELVPPKTDPNERDFRKLESAKQANLNLGVKSVLLGAPANDKDIIHLVVELLGVTSGSSNYDVPRITNKYVSVLVVDADGLSSYKGLRIRR